MSILNTFGITWVGLIEYSVNFLILLVILRIFLYKPILEILNKRKGLIQKTIDESNTVEKLRIEIEKERKEILKKATIDSEKIVEDMRKSVDKLRDELIKKSQNEASNVIQKAKLEIENEKNEVIASLTDRISRIIENTLLTVLKDELSKKDIENITQKCVEAIEGKNI